jgi:SPP1 gp7 family putative phage head morphogenesis protein
MPPEILDQALRYKADLAAREAVIVRSMATNWLGIMRQLDDEIAKIAATMAVRRAQGLEVTAGYLYRTERYQTLLRQAYAQFVRYEDFATALIGRNQQLYARLGREYGVGLLETLQPGVRQGIARLSVGAIENAAGFVDDGPLRALLADAWPQAIQQTTSALVKGVGLGYGPERIAKMMNDGMSSGLYRSMVIARTETMRAYRQAKFDTWESSGLVTGYQRVATHDRRTCPSCLMLDGAVLRSPAEFASHPQCRCTIIPLTKGNPIHKWQYGEQWLEEQPPATQIRMASGTHRLKRHSRCAE